MNIACAKHISDGTGQMFDSLIHSDWSTDGRKEWMTAAKRTARGMEVGASQPVPCAPEFVDRCLFGGQKVLAGFDFPIGVPAAFGRQTGFGNFRDALAEFGRGEWGNFFSIADSPEDITLRRPFYPRTSRAGS